MRSTRVSVPDGLDASSRRLVEALRDIKNGLDMTLAEIGARTHYSTSSWERWFNGKRLITRAALLSLADIAGADRDHLLALLERATLGCSDSIDSTDSTGSIGAKDAKDAKDAEDAEDAEDADSTPAPPAELSTPPRHLRTGISRSPIRQLPTDTRHFVGRAREVEYLIGKILARETGDLPQGAATVFAISGMGGIGKTAVAVRVAHQVGDRFPDGQLFIDLHGYSADLAPLGPADALDYLLRSLGVPAEAIPAQPEDRAALYRSTLAGTRTLIVLDNAVGAAQVRALLPATPGCVILITSRNRLTSLDDAHLLTLDLLREADALALLRDIVGDGRIAQADQADATALVDLCGRVPLAVRIVAARIRHRSTLTVRAVIEELREERDRLERLSDGERDLVSVFNSTLAVLPESDQRLFRFLGLVPGPDFDAYAAASLVGSAAVREVERSLERLVDYHLLIQQTPRRYRFHDLLRSHARRLAGVDQQGPAAFARLLDYYIAAARAAENVLPRRVRPAVLRTRSYDGPVEPVEDREQSMDWFRTERSNLLEAATHRDSARDQRVALIDALCAFLAEDGHWNTAAELDRLAVDSAREIGDRLAEANALTEWGYIGERLGRLKAAEEHLMSALAAYRDLGSRQGEANALYGLGRTRFQRGHRPSAQGAVEQSLTIFRELRNRRGEAMALGLLGATAHVAGDSAKGLELFYRSIALLEEVGDLGGLADTLRGAAFCAYALERFDEVRTTLERAERACRQVGGKQRLAHCLFDLAQTLLRVGDYQQAETLLTEALAHYRAIGFSLGEGNVHWGLGRIARARGDYPVAQGLYEQALDMFLSIDSSFGEALVTHELAHLRHQRGDVTTAGELLRYALSLYVEGDFLTAEVEVRNSIAKLALETEGPETGLDLFRRSFGDAVRARHPLERARALEGMAQCELALGRFDAGVAHLRDAVDLYRRMNAAECAEAHSRLVGLMGS